MDYFNSIKKLSTDDFDEFKKEYVGSKEEEEDLVKLYLQFKGSLMKIIENSYFGRITDDEERYFQLLEKKIDNGKLERFSDWRLLNRRERLKLKKRQEREEKELEKVMKKKEKETDDNSLSIYNNVKRKNEEMFDSLIAGLEAKYGRGINNHHEKKNQKKKKKK
jgi:DnaJ family protein C protein 9